MTGPRLTSAFVILAAGRGSRVGRVGESLHKALLPLGERAVLSRLFDLAPVTSEIIICLGHRGDQIREFVRLAHPNRHPTFIEVGGWDRPGGGPGLSLLAAKEAIGDRDLIFTSCDTLWESSDDVYGHEQSWAAVAPIPAGTQPARWCRIVDHNGRAADILDKVPDGPTGLAYTGAAGVVQRDLQEFWRGIEYGDTIAGERQVTGGLHRLMRQGTLKTHRIHWLDVGDATAYSHAVTLHSGYDWTKVGEATYVMPEERRVVKFWDDAASGNRSAERAEYIGRAVPQLVDRGRQMLAYEYVPGVTVYQALETSTYDGLFGSLYTWADVNLWKKVDAQDVELAAYEFYRTKTLERVEMLQPELFIQASDVVARVDWDELVRGTMPVRFHGDFNAGNVIATIDGAFIGIDWRGDFAGQPWGDRRYDEAKLLAGCLIHWDRARRGDFRPWDEGAKHFADVLERIPPVRRRNVQIIGALSLLNSAPLHAAPLDEVLVVRGTRWLDEVL